MRHCYMLFHRRFVEIDKERDRIHATILCGFFSSRKKCKETLPEYLKQPGFIDYPDDFHIEKVTANIDDYNKIPGEFEQSVFFLSHEWYDGVYDHITRLGYYSTKKLAENAMKSYGLESDFLEHLDDFNIGEYDIDDREWTEGFFTWA